jgi:hypothetical protein
MPESFDLRPLLKGMLVEMEETTNPLSAMEVVMDNLSSNPTHYDAFKIEKEEESEGEEEMEVEEVGEGEEFPTPTAISTVLTQIADYIDKSKQPSKKKIVASLERMMTSLRRHPHFKTAHRECNECGGKGKHHNWCPRNH